MSVAGQGARAGGQEREGSPGGRHPAGVAQQEAPDPPLWGWGVPVAESVLAPPGPIPNPVVTQRSAGEYCGGDPTGGEAAAGTPHLPTESAVGRGGREAAQTLIALSQCPAHNAGWSSGSSLGS